MEPLGPSFSCRLFHQGVKASRLPVKQLLLAGKLVVGVGNIYASEALYLAGIRPTVRASSLGPVRIQRLYQAIGQVLGKAIELGGSSLKDFQVPTDLQGISRTLFRCTAGRDYRVTFAAPRENGQTRAAQRFLPELPTLSCASVPDCQSKGELVDGRCYILFMSACRPTITFREQSGTLIQRTVRPAWRVASRLCTAAQATCRVDVEP